MTKCQTLAKSYLELFHPKTVPKYMLCPTYPTILPFLLCFCLPTEMGGPEGPGCTPALASPEEPSGAEVGMAKASRAPSGQALFECLHVCQLV